MKIVKAHKGHVHDVVFSPDGMLLATAGQDKTIKLWDRKTGNEIANLTGHKKGIGSVAFSPDGTLLASASLDSSIRLWEICSGRQQECFQRSDGCPCVSVAFSPDGTELAAGTSEKVRGKRKHDAVLRWNLSTKEVLPSPENYGNALDISYSPNGDLIGVVGKIGLTLWSVRTGEKRGRFTGRVTRALSFSPNGDLLAVAEATAVLLIGATHIQPEVFHGYLAGPSSIVTGVSFAPESDSVLVSHSNGVVCLWDVTTRHMKQFECAVGKVNGIAVTPDGQSVAAVGSEGSFAVWDY